MFRSILVPLDLESQGDQALPVAANLAHAAGIPVDLVTVSSPNLDETDDLAALQRRIDLLSPVEASGSVLHDADDDVARALAGAVAERPRVLTVMATHAHTAVGELLLGSTTEKLLARSVGPLLLIGPEVDPSWKGEGPLLVAVDTWDAVDALVVCVTDWTSTFWTDTLVVQAVDDEGSPVPAGADTGEFGLVEGVAGALRRSGVGASWDVLHGTPARALVDRVEQEGACAVAVASARWGEAGMAGWHSMTRQLVRHSPVPVLVVPTERSASRTGPST